MHYQRLLLDDFGVFQRAEMADLDAGLTVIAGPQRAGKTTFMEALRRFGYGITQGEDIPPPADTYRLSAELVQDDYSYRLSLDGYSDPHLTSLDRDATDASQLTLDDIFGALSKEQYRQLYTLSLDQLQRLPPTVEEPEELSRILLGAAYGSIADLPQIKEAFAEQAHEIGRTRGHPRYGQFSDAFEQIQEGQEELEAANKQVEEHDAKRADLDRVKAQLDSLETERDRLTLEQRRLNEVQQFFDDFHRYRQLGEQLADIDPERADAFPDDGLARAEELARQFDAACDRVREAREAFVAETGSDDPAVHRDELLAVADELERYQAEVSGWRERLRTIREQDTELAERRAELEQRIQQLRSDLSGAFDEVTQIETDLLSRDAVKQAVDDVLDAQAAVDDCETDLATTRERRDEIEQQLVSADADGGSRQGLVIASGGGIAGVLVAIGLAAAVSAIAGVVVGALLVLVAAAIAFRRSRSGAGDGSQRTQLQAQQNQVEQDIAELEQRRAEATADLEQAQRELASIREQLGVDDALSPEGVRQFYSDLVELQADIRAFEQDEEHHRDERATLAGELSTVAETVARVRDFAWDEEAPLEHAEALFAAVERAADEVDLAADWDTARTEQTRVREQVVAFFEAWDDGVTADDLADADPETVMDALDQAVAEGERLAEAADHRAERQDIESDLRARFRVDAVRDAFAAAYEPDSDSNSEAAVDDWYLDAFEAVADQYASIEEVETRLNDIDTRLEAIDTERDGLRDRQTELEQELEDLASEDDLIAARQKIQAGARTIDRLGEEYATYRIAEEITDRLQNRFIEETTGPLLDEAGAIFARITAEYDGIEHTGELEDLDFRVLQDGDAVRGRSELSRATAEQLFMAVRLARIRQIETPLPVVFDDALTNFDPAHSARTMQLIDELATTNQVFLLTAHPAFVDLASEYADVAQFWRLDSGQFAGPFEDAERAIAKFAADSASATR